MKTKKVNYLLIGFVLLSVFFGYKYVNLKIHSQSKVELASTLNNEYAMLNVEYDLLMKEFHALEDSSVNLNNNLSKKRIQLMAEKDRLARLYEEGKLTKQKLDKARFLISDLRIDKNELLEKINALGKENYALRTENKSFSQQVTHLSNKKDSLQQKAHSLENETVHLKSATEELYNEKQQLEKEHFKNAPKVEFANVIPVKEIQAQGVKYKSSGKEKSTTKTNQAEKIKIQFTTQKNPVVEVGKKQYYIRIIDPKGVVLFDKQYGSGIFESLQEGKNIKYTVKTTVDYDGNEENVTLLWKQNYGYEAGNYYVQIYNRGYQVGKSTFLLH